MKKEDLIIKYEIMLKTVREVIQTADLNEDVLTAQGCERFLKGFIADLKEIESIEDFIEQFLILVEDPKVGGYTAIFKIVPGVISEGETKEKAITNLLYTIQDIIAFRKKRRLK